MGNFSPRTFATTKNDNDMSNTKNTGGPAFPATMEQLSRSIQGMTLRDYLAAKAMQGLIAGVADYDEDVVSKSAYAMADEMLKAREQ